MKLLFPIHLFLTIIPLSAAEAPKRNENTVVLDETGVKNLAIELAAAEESRFDSTILVLGGIDHTCESHAVLSSRVAGRINEVFAHKGDFVRKGAVVARMESRQPGNPPPVIDLIAPGDGLVIESATHLGAPVEPERELMTILDLTKVRVLAKVPQHHGGLLKEGLNAVVRVPAIGGGEIVAGYHGLGVEADVAKGTIDAIFELPNPGMRLRPGMRAELTLVTASREGVLSVPREALQGDHSNHFVFIKDYELESAFVKTPVVVGARNETRVEIVSGLFPGDEVVTRGAYPLAFAGKGSASLREALDAAHGHPHNEDGTEMTREQIAAADGEDLHGHDHGGHSNSSSLVLFLSIACGLLFVLLLASPFVFRARSKA